MQPAGAQQLHQGADSSFDFPASPRDGGRGMGGGLAGILSFKGTPQCLPAGERTSGWLSRAINAES